MNKKFVQFVVFEVLKKIKETGDVSVGLIGDKKMRTLNRDYRGKDKTTDVLSFAMREKTVLSNADLGDIFLSPAQIKRQARQNNISFKEEATRMLIHGVLHLCGYDHIKKKDYDVMIPLQEKILRKLITHNS